MVSNNLAAECACAVATKINFLSISIQLHCVINYDTIVEISFHVFNIMACYPDPAVLQIIITVKIVVDLQPPRDFNSGRNIKYIFLLINKTVPIQQYKNK